MRCFKIIEGVVHTLIFEALFPGCQHGVGERVSLRGAVNKSAESQKATKFLADKNFDMVYFR